MKNARLLLSLVLLVVFCGCGYHLPGRGNNLPDDVRTLYVAHFANRTAEPFLEDHLTDLVTREFGLRQTLRLTEDAAGADAVLSGAVVSYTNRSISYGSDDETSEYRSLMEISAELRRSADGRSLWKGHLSWSEEYPSSDDKIAQEDNESAAIEEIVARLAEELYFRIVDNF